MKNVYELEDVNEIINRINNLTNETQPQWGKMNVAQMLKHCNVAYDIAFEPQNFKKAKGLKRWALKTFLKPIVVNNKPYKKNSPTAPEFKVAPKQNFENEKQSFIDNVTKTQKLGASHFNGKENLGFGTMTSTEWNALFYKHLDHHLRQFGV